MRERDEFLEAAAMAAAEGKPLAVTVRELLSYWNAKGRGTQVVATVQRDLTASGLQTDPSFMKVALDARVDIVSTAAAAPVDEEDVSPPGSDDVVGLTVGNLEAAFSGIVSVSPSSTFEEAQTKMLLDDFSQLPVMNGQRTVAGAVTWESIAQAKLRNPDAPFSAAIVRHVPVVPYDQDLFGVVATIAAAGFVLVRDSKGVISGVVTTTDLTEQYAELAEPFLLLGEIDRLLRREMRRAFDLEFLARILGEELESFDDLSMGDYQRVLESPQHWEALGWSLERSEFIKRFSQIRSLRNDVMHFNPDPTGDSDLDDLRVFVKVVRSFAA